MLLRACFIRAYMYWDLSVSLLPVDEVRSFLYYTLHHQDVPLSSDLKQQMQLAPD